MTSFYSRSAAAASPWGLLLSVCLHGLMFLAVISLSISISKVNKPVEESISHVKLVAPQAYSPVVEHIQQGPAEAPNVLPEVRTEPELPEKVSEKPRAILEARAVAPQNRDVITIKKRKKPPRRVEAAKEPDKKKPQPETAKKKEDPSLSWRSVLLLFARMSRAKRPTPRRQGLPKAPAPRPRGGLKGNREALRSMNSPLSGLTESGL